MLCFFFFSSRRRHTRFDCDWSSDVCSSDLVSVAINVSAPQFFESDFVAHVARTLQATGLPASALELEITETVFQTGPATVDSLHQLRALGVAGALEDFGIGYSSPTPLEP